MAVTVGGHDVDDWEIDVKAVVWVAESGKKGQTKVVEGEGNNGNVCP
ncbi:hypothetical protein Hanom_Chr05g00422471 [Helianthus anomalus]